MLNTLYNFANILRTLFQIMYVVQVIYWYPVDTVHSVNIL